MVIQLLGNLHFSSCKWQFLQMAVCYFNTGTAAHLTDMLFCLDDAEGDAHQFFLVAAFLPTSGQSAH